ncbi:MAG: alpha-galactosidase [Limnochordales bacterium]|nr:alpha-galactosidase [Limnochordales bacterium]
MSLLVAAGIFPKARLSEEKLALAHRQPSPAGDDLLAESMEGAAIEAWEYTGRFYRARLDLVRLLLSVQDDKGEFLFALHLNGKARQRQKLRILDDVSTMAMKDWRVVNNPEDKGTEVRIRLSNRFADERRARTQESREASWSEGEAILCFRPDYFTYRLSLWPDREDDATVAVEDIIYGAGSALAVSTSRLWVWRPDNYSVSLAGVHNLGETVSVWLGTNEESARYVIPPYLAAFGNPRENTWWAVGLMEIPNAAGMILDVSPLPDTTTATGSSPVQFQIRFPTGGQVRGSATTPVAGPEAVFIMGPKSEGLRDRLLKRYVEILDERGLVFHPRQWVDWWSGPIYCTWGDQELAARVRGGSAFDYLNEQQIDAWLKRLAHRQIPVTAVILDSGWSDAVGEWTVHPRWGATPEERVKNLRAYIDRLHQQGKKVLLWYTPHWVSKNSKPAREHPEWLLRDLFGSPASTCGFYLFDYTNPETRAYVAERLRFLLGDGPGQLNADGLKVDFLYDNPDIHLPLAHPEWGIGERYSYNVQKFIYDTVKSIKPWAYVESSAANPFYNDVQDADRLNDDYMPGYTPERYLRRAWVHSLASLNAMDSDDWHAYLEYVDTLFARRAAIGIPALYSSEYRFGPGNQPVALTSTHYARVAAIFQVYRRSPFQLGQAVRVDLANDEFTRWDVDESGNPVRLRAAAMEDGSALVAAELSPAELGPSPSSTEALPRIWITSVRDQELRIPLPSGTRVVEVRARRLDGGLIPARPAWREAPGALVLEVRDAGSIPEGIYYEVVLAEGV